MKNKKVGQTKVNSLKIRRSTSHSNFNNSIPQNPEKSTENAEKNFSLSENSSTKGGVLGEKDGDVELYEGGEIGVYSETPVKVVADGKEVEVSEKGRLKSFILSAETKKFSVR